MPNQSNGAFRDEHYDLVSVLYHALQGAETVNGYLGDAEEAGDQELAGFFREVEQQYRKLADQGKQLLANRTKQLAA